MDKKIFIVILYTFFTLLTSAQCPVGGNQNGFLGCGGFDECVAKAKNLLEWVVRGVRSIDPNTITGPQGYAAPQWVSVKDKMAFRVDFENDGKSATAPAQNVFIKMPVHPKFNINSFRLGSFGFGQFNFQAPDNATYYTTRLDLKDSLGLFVDFSAGIDVISHQVFWSFRSIDPATGLAPTNALTGLLAVSDTGAAALTDTVSKGKGYVSFLISPDSTVAHTGDTTAATASITFDANEAVPTNIWTNTIDAAPPVSYVKLLPASSDPNFTLQWSGKDDSLGSGLKHFTIYYKKGNGSFAVLKAATDSTSMNFPGGEAGATYSFYSIATDNTGNREAPKTTAEASTIIQSAQSICPGDNAIFTMSPSASGYTYQWQVDDGNGYSDITNNSVYSGATTASLTLISPPTSWYGYKFRAIATNNGNTVQGTPQVLKFSNTWTGSQSTAWENATNWSCGRVPDEYTDVFINPETPHLPVVTSNGICRSLTLANGVVFTVSAGYNLQIRGK